MTPVKKASPFLRRRYRQPNRRRASRVLLTLVGGLLVYTVVLGDSGFLRLHTERTEVERMQRQVDQLEERRRELDDRLTQLRARGSDTLERVAREQYGMLRDGERVIHILDEDDRGSSEWPSP